MDTAKDARVLVLEDALRRLGEIISNRKLKLHLEYSRLSQLIQTASTALYEVKYSYVDPMQLAASEGTKKIVDCVSEIGVMMHSAIASVGFKPKTTKEQLVVAELNYALRTVEGFQRRLKSGSDEAGLAVDILAVEVSQTRPVAGASKLTHCRCSDGKRAWNIVTNIAGIRVGSKLPCAVLPPVEMMDTVSEAMFLGGDPLPEGTPLGPIVAPSRQMLDQARAQTLRIIERL
ncbi:MAG: hypothetical protein HXY34_11270 [Candidatus Thorarchaeota archaeon]|nr:hypothetical protein [Candidatus Thorarchaeota archaeon]